MRVYLIAAIAALLLAETSLAAPTSMLHSLPQPSAAPATPQAAVAPRQSGHFGWFTKWFRGEHRPAAVAQPPGSPPQGVVAYQPPQQAPAIQSAPLAAAIPAAPSPSAGALDAKSLRNEARTKDREGDLAAAEQCYRQAIAADPTSAAAVNDLGLCLARQGKLEPSAAVLRQAITMRPDKTLYRNNIATVLVELGRPQEALAQLQAVSNPATANFNVGQLLTRSSKNDQACEYLRQALACDPAMEPARQALAALAPAAPSLPVSPMAPSPTMAGVAPAPTLAPPEPEYQQVASAPQTTQLEPAAPSVFDDEEIPSGAPAFPRLLPPVINR